MTGVRITIPTDPEPAGEFDWKMAFQVLMVFFVVWVAFNWLATERLFEEKDQRQQCEALMEGEMDEFRHGLLNLKAFLAAKEAELAGERARFNWNLYPEDPPIIVAEKESNDGET